MDIRKETCLIIQRKNEFLVGVIHGSLDLRWSPYAHEAWRTRKREDADQVARMVGGTVMLFNPVVRQLRKAEG